MSMECKHETLKVGVSKKPVWGYSAVRKHLIKSLILSCHLSLLLTHLLSWMQWLGHDNPPPHPDICLQNSLHYFGWISANILADQGKLDACVTSSEIPVPDLHLGFWETVWSIHSMQRPPILYWSLAGSTQEWCLLAAQFSSSNLIMAGHKSRRMPTKSAHLFCFHK